MNQSIRLVTNVKKSQISDDGEFFKIKGIPVTVNNAVMNGLLYPEDENAKGMPSINGRLMTLGHPKNSSGETVSTADGEALVNHFGGGSVGFPYLTNGVHYVDAKIRKATLKAQPNGEWFYNRLDRKLPIGVSTGLFSDRDMTAGVTTNGKEYFGVARNQRYDHLALLHESEPPAGGKDTFINFNSADQDLIINVNVDDYIVNKSESKLGKAMAFFKELLGNEELENNESSFNDIQDLIRSKLKSERKTKQDEYLYPRETYDTFFIYEKDGTMLKQVYMNDDGVITFVGEPKAVIKDVDWKEIKSDLNTNEDNAMRTEMLAELKVKGIAVNAEITDTELMAKYKESLTANSAAGTGDSKLLDAINALTAKVDAMEKTKLTAEEEAKAKKAKELAANSAIAGLGFVEADLLKMETNRLDDLYAKHSGQIVGNAYAGMGARTEGVAEIDLNSLLQGAE
jgi:hypothetical protein